MPKKQATMPSPASTEQPVLEQAPALEAAPAVEPEAARVEELAQLEPAPVVEAEPVPAPQPEPEPVPVETLASYAARVEELAQPLAVCEITHPAAVDGKIHIGKYAGIRLVRGDVPAALVSDGSVL